MNSQHFHLIASAWNCLNDAMEARKTVEAVCKDGRRVKKWSFSHKMISLRVELYKQHLTRVLQELGY
jgi:hypothetical protein